MKMKRSQHAVSLVKLADVIDFCQRPETKEEKPMPSHPHLMSFLNNTKNKAPDVDE